MASGAVQRVANYGLKDGKVFDFISRTTPTGGSDQNFLAQVLSPAQPCREAVRQIQAARRRRGKPAISAATGAYCQARRKLPNGPLRICLTLLVDDRLCLGRAGRGG